MANETLSMMLEMGAPIFIKQTIETLREKKMDRAKIDIVKGTKIYSDSTDKSRKEVTPMEYGGIETFKNPFGLRLSPRMIKKWIRSISVLLDEERDTVFTQIDVNEKLGPTMEFKFKISEICQAK